MEPKTPPVWGEV